MKTQITTIPVSDIRPNPENPRKKMDENELQELAQSIRSIGLLQPITVRKMVEIIDAENEVFDDYYEIVCGHRRFEAAKRAAMVEVPCIVRELSDDEAFEVMITENLQRKDVNPFDEAAAFETMSRRGYDTETLAGKFGKSKTYILSRMKLSSLISEFREKFDDGQIDFSHCLVLARLDPGFQRQLLERYGTNAYGDLSHATVDALKTAIGNYGKRLQYARFDTSMCKSCIKNTACGSVFLDTDEAICEDVKCYVEKEAEWCVGQFEIVRKRNPNFFIISEKNPSRLNDLEKRLYFELERRKFTFVEGVSEYSYERAEYKHRYDISDESIQGFSFGWMGFLGAKKADAGKPAASKWINEYRLKEMANHYEAEINSRKHEIVRSRILKLSDEELGSRHFPHLLESMLAFLVSQCNSVYTAFGPLKGDTGTDEVNAAIESMAGAGVAAAICKFLADSINDDEGMKFLLMDFRDLEEGALEAATRKFYDACRDCYHGYGPMTDEEIDLELEKYRG